jgi:hypothetical protein
VRRQSEGPGSVEELFVQDEDPVQVGAQSAQAWQDGVGRGIFPVEDEDVAGLDSWGTVREGSSGGEAGAEIERDQGLAQLLESRL